ncbi:MAG: AAA family ATPase [Alphaproteobacteria bacterium]|nr:AAA family ATPase [Alphaproteobacteria bacterium]
MKHNATIAYYINNLSSANLPQKAANSLLDFAEGVSTELLGYDLCDHWGLSPEKKVRRGRIRIPVDTSDAKNTSDVPCTRSIKKLRDIMSGLLVIDICSPGIDKCMDSLTNLFGLNETERRLVQLFADNVRDSQVRALIQDVMCDNFRFRTCLDLYNLDMIAAMCGLSYAAVNRALDPDGLLVRAGILAIDDSDGEITLNRFISRHLTDGITSVPELKRALLGKPHTADKGLDFSHVSDKYDYIKSLIKNAVSLHVPGINILIYGATGTGKTAMAKHIVSSLGYDLYGLNTSNKCRQEKNINQSYLMHAQRILSGDHRSVIMLDEAEDIFRYNPYSSNATSKLSLNQMLERNARPVIWLTNDITCIDPAYLRRFTYCCELPSPSSQVKTQIWSGICRRHRYKISDTELKSLADKYDVVPGVIDTAVRAACMTGDSDAIVRTLESYCIATMGHVPVSTSNNIVPFDTRLLNTDLDMDKLATQIQNGKCQNFSLCLYGASGTGKSAYARYLADKLGLRIIQKRASDLQDKYVGETEKRIAAAFREAADQGAILVFDEADSFLRDRTHARAQWEVSAVNEMLTQMESTNVPFICTTNLMNDIDRAALRRFLFKVKYDYMTIPQVVLAFSDFFDLTVSESDVRNLTYLTPGDFAVVKRRADIMGTTDTSELINMLSSEMAAKNIRNSNRIGF